MDNQLKSHTPDENQIKKVLLDFYDAYYMADRIKMFSYLNQSFQDSISLNCFLIHSDFDIDVGILIEIRRIHVERQKKFALAECLVDFERGKKETVIAFKLEDEMWKIDGRSVYKRKL
ncbi:hypothetical protein [Aminipila terrae]|uniref:NTF2 fold immunity protein domain-containing protein n=1 Tax=Aminipila terrae TaxID=2697030 RepID=A0A6P1MLV1_9FIRM|nr:hypothetical protein [Aminipila terrae]QHI72626.1 hypothetical protein Ami3637_09650 [Aminipila terrae]